jgi:uncharacterized protein DUF3768
VTLGSKEQLKNVETNTARIAELNDLARTAMGIASRVVQTQGISALPQRDQSRIRELVETFDAFTPGNNPHGERDLGVFEYTGRRIMWKIDYYDKALEYHSEDASDPAKTIRLLTIMLAEEY